MYRTYTKRDVLVFCNKIMEFYSPMQG